MQICDDSIGSLAHPREVLSRDEAATTGPHRVEEDLRGAGTWRGLYSPTQVTQPVDRQVLLPPVRRGLVSLMGRTSKTTLGLGIVGRRRLRSVPGFAADLKPRGRDQCPRHHAAGAD